MRQAKLLQSFGGSKPQQTGGSEPQNSRRDLFLGLAPIFEALHSPRNYAVSKYPNRRVGARETFSAGPAVMWTQELFKLAADPLRTRPPGSPIPELVELHAWSEATREGFVKRIDEGGGCIGKMSGPDLVAKTSVGNLMQRYRPITLPSALAGNLV
jgi:hypothetical protein